MVLNISSKVTGFLRKYIIICLCHVFKSTHHYMVEKELPWMADLLIDNHIKEIIYKVPWNTKMHINTVFLKQWKDHSTGFSTNRSHDKKMCWLPRCQFQRAIYIHLPIRGSPWRLHFRADQQMKLNIGDFININVLINIFNIHACFPFPFV